MEGNGIISKKEKGTVSANLIQILEFRMNSKSNGRRRGEI